LLVYSTLFATFLISSTVPRPGVHRHFSPSKTTPYRCPEGAWFSLLETLSRTRKEKGHPFGSL
jgi:hypothetical protein